MVAFAWPFLVITLIQRRWVRPHLKLLLDLMDAPAPSGPQLPVHVVGDEPASLMIALYAQEWLSLRLISLLGWLLPPAFILSLVVGPLISETVGGFVALGIVGSIEVGIFALPIASAFLYGPGQSLLSLAREVRVSTSPLGMAETLTLSVSDDEES